jgi:hypothetical protein
MLLEMRNVGLGICGTLHRVGRRISPDRAVVSPAKPLNITGANREKVANRTSEGRAKGNTFGASSKYEQDRNRCRVKSRNAAVTLGSVMRQVRILTARALILFIASATLAAAAPTVYVALGSGNLVIAIDPVTDHVTASYSGVENPHGLVATPDGEYLIAGSLKEMPAPPGAAPDFPTSKLFLVHPAHGHVMSSIPVAGWSHHQAITLDGRYVISTHPVRGGISVLELRTEKIVRTLATGRTPNFTLISRDGRRAFVSNTGDGTVSEIDLNDWRVVRQLDAGPTPEHLVFSRDEKVIYAASNRAGQVSVVNVASGKVERSYALGKKIHGLDIGDDGKTLFVSDQIGNKLIALDPESGATRSIELTPALYHLGVIRGTGKVYVSSRDKPLIWVVDQKRMVVVNTIALPAGEGHQIALVH